MTEDELRRYRAALGRSADPPKRGRRQTCACGTCQKCATRERVREHRALKKQLALIELESVRAAIAQ
jgi:hypothetical protein